MKKQYSALYLYALELKKQHEEEKRKEEDNEC